MTDYHREASPAPKPGLCVALPCLPSCDVCGSKEARYDAATKMGPWAYLCGTCYGRLAASTELGVGRGQRLVKEES
jgi:hypothetical protein